VHAELPVVIVNWPATHAKQNADDDDPVNAEKVPVGQLKQIVPPDSAVNWPTLQVAHDADALLVEYWPAGHGAQSAESYAPVFGW